MSEAESAARTRVLKSGNRSVWVHRRVRLIIETAPQTGQRFDIPPGLTRVGSGESAELHLGDETVSELHFEIAFNDSGLTVTDLGSTNGTRVDGVAVVQARLHDGARITAGTTTLRVELGDEESEEVELSKRTNFGGLLGHSPAMRSLFATLENVAKTDATVLIQGESGTGKELAARAIHGQSRRRDGPYVVFDCGAAPENLIESLLFGHQKGAFTGATEARAGVFEDANTGTLVLDEIGELPLLLQPKLLRVLESKSIQRLGETRVRPCDVRIVASTNRNLAQEVRAGNFREDLFFRLSVITLRLPALRERREEIPRLAAHFLGQLRGDDATRLPDETLRLLEAHDWPGNVRELRNVVERLVTLPELSARDALGETLDPTKPSSTGPSSASPSPEAPRFQLPFHDAKEHCLENFERRYLEHWLDACSGNVSEAARSIGLARQSVHRLIKKHGLDHSD